MKSIQLGNLEEMVLLLVGTLRENAYSVAIVEEYEKQTGSSVNISAIHTVLYRLEKKGFLESSLGDPNTIRGGKRKRIFSLTSLAVKSLADLADVRNQLIRQVPELAIQS